MVWISGSGMPQLHDGVTGFPGLTPSRRCHLCRPGVVAPRRVHGPGRRGGRRQRWPSCRGRGRARVSWATQAAIRSGRPWPPWPPTGPARNPRRGGDSARWPRPRRHRLDATAAHPARRALAGTGRTDLRRGACQLVASAGDGDAAAITVLLSLLGAASLAGEPALRAAADLAGAGVSWRTCVAALLARRAVRRGTMTIGSSS